MEFKTVGITFRIKDNPKIAKLKPKGEVSFIPEPDNKHDKNGNIPIAIWYKDYHIGYVPSDCNANWTAKNGKVKECVYIDNNGTLNNNGKGQLVSVPIEVDDKIEVLKFLRLYDFSLWDGRELVKTEGDLFSLLAIAPKKSLQIIE